MTTNLIATPEVAHRLRLKSLTAFLLPVWSIEAADRFDEVVRICNSSIRFYFNQYQLGFNMTLGTHIGITEDLALAAKQIYASEEPGMNLLRSWLRVFAPSGETPHPIYAVGSLAVVRREELVPFQIGATAAEIPILFPALKTQAYLLQINLAL